MASRNENQVQMTIRVGAELAEQIAAMASLQHRSRTAEINILLEEAIDARVQRDRDLAMRMGGPL